MTLPIVELGMEALENALSGEQRVWLIDDPRGSGQALCERMSSSGIEFTRITVSPSGELPALPDTRVPGAILIDAALASGQGWHVLKEVRENPATRNSPILFFSFGQESDSGAVLSMDYLTKPIGSAEMTQALRRQGLENSADEKTILVVDDDASLLEMHVRIIQACSPLYRVLKALDGREALNLIRQEHPDLVLLDLAMPVMDGFQLLEQLRASEATRQTSVVVLTGQTLTDTDMQRLNKGVGRILQKGVFTVDETIAHIRQVLGKQKKLSTEAQYLARKAMAYIHAHYASPITRKEIARHIRISEDHLTRYFQHVLGIPPMAYLARYRVARAKALLEDGELSVAEVAAAVGFHNQFYFSRVFRRETGRSPSAYRPG